MTERTDTGHFDDGIRLSRDVLKALPPLDRGDEAIKAIIEGMIAAAELLQPDDIESTEL